MSERKYLTLGEAQKLLPEVRRRLLKVMKLNKAIELLSEIEVSFFDEVESMYSEINFNKKFHNLCFKLFSELEVLMKKGASLDSIESGTVNFHSVHNGKPVVFCWQMGDKHIKYWHEVDEDFSERKPISKLS